MAKRMEETIAMMRSMGIEPTKTQMKKMEEWQSTFDAASAKVNGWKAKGECYTADVFPEYVRESMKHCNDSVDEAIGAFAKRVFKKYPEEFKDYFCVLEGKTYFNTSGYRTIVSNAVGYEWVDRDMQEQWRKDSGVFQGFENAYRI